jgi:sugar phosphate isomerase/epimerase
MNNIYISSLAFLGSTPENMIREAKENEFAIEFSSGMPFRDDMEEIYYQAEIKKIPHNYFPAPEIPFVLNLASKDQNIRERSIKHCIQGLRMSKKSGAPFFSAHAGFCIDPNSADLGNQLDINGDFDIDYHKNLFLVSIQEILKEAHQLETDFLIENNVIASFNLTNEGRNPLLCCDSNDIRWLFKEISDKRCGLLLDTAHLKVSSVTLNLDLNQEIGAISTLIRALHHSDNDGIRDTNLPITENYWFLQYMKQYQSVSHVLEVKRLTIQEIKNQIKLLKIWMLKN